MTITELKLKGEVRDASEAKALLDNPLLKDALDTMEQQYLSALLQCDVGDDTGRFRFSEGIKVARMLTRQLGLIVQNGKLPQAELDAMKGDLNRFF